MLLTTLLTETGDFSQPYGEGEGAIQVFGDDRRYWTLLDYVVSSVVSGPSIILIPRDRLASRREQSAGTDPATEPTTFELARDALVHVWDEDFETEPAATAKAILGLGGWPNGEPIDDETERPALELLAELTIIRSYPTYTLSELEALPRRAVGQTADLKLKGEYDGEPGRLWLNRTGVDDGEPWDNGVCIEICRGGSWVVVSEYQARMED
ncbi:MAG: hypothetical protein ACE5F1_16245 [Planctomycetota bacterium]